jgi:chromosome segregation ATPase
VKWLKILMALSLMFCSISVGIFFLRLASDTKQIAQSVQQTAVQIQTTTKDVDEYMTATLNSVQGVSETAASTLNDIDNTIQNEQASIKAANQATVKAMQDLDTLVVNADASQKQVIASVQATLTAVQKTTESVLPVMDQTHKDLAALEPAINQIQPLLQQSTDTMTHVSQATADISTEIHKYVYPQPQKWYQKLWGVTKLGMHMLTYPL